MKVRILCLVLIGVLILGDCNAVPLNEMEARAFTQSFSSREFERINHFIQEVFNYNKDDPNGVVKAFTAIFKYAEDAVELINESKQFDESKFADPELKEILKIIRRSGNKAILGREKFLKIFIARALIMKLEKDKNIPAFHNASVELAMVPDIHNIFAKSNDPEELKYYWTAWKNKNSVWAKGNFANVINLLNEAANLTDISTLEFMLDGYNATEMERVSMQIQPLYLQLHGFVRNQLYTKYGDTVIKANGPIPHHLFEQVLAQAWSPGSIIDSMFPHKDLPPYDEILIQNKYDPLKIYKMANEFYQSMGFTPIPKDYWGNHIKMRSNENEGQCKSTIFDMTSNVYMEYCQKLDFKTFIEAHGFMGRVYYAREKTDLPAYYFKTYLLQNSVGAAAVLSASTSKHLNAIGLVPDIMLNEDVQMNRLLRMGICTLLNMPVYFVHTKLMADFFAGSVDFPDLNKHYWKMMDKYVGVAPPVDRGPDAYDFPLHFFLQSSKEKDQTEFMTEVLGYQIYEKLCEISGQYLKKMHKSEPIQNCDFYGSKSAGDALKKMMRLGSSKPLRDVLATMFPEDNTVNAESLLEYYSPMKSWLAEKNRQDNWIVGWKHS